MGSTETRSVDPDRLDRLDRLDPQSSRVVTMLTTLGPAPSTGTERTV